MTIGDLEYGSGFRLARHIAIGRPGGICQFCGHAPATEGHHWAKRYPSDISVTANDITALCRRCHRVATTLRRQTRDRELPKDGPTPGSWLRKSFRGTAYLWGRSLHRC